MKQKSNRVLRVILSLLVGLAFFLLVMSGLIDAPAGFLNDVLYNRSSFTDGEIVVIGMDEAALDVLGPMPWPRNIMADVITSLNADEDNKPAVIGVDVLYVGEGSDPAADEALVRAARDGGNVVMAASGAFGATLEIGDDESFRMNEKTLTAFDPPFDALREAAEIGHVNAMPDSDGVIRHALLSLDDPDTGETVYAFGRKVYEKYAAFHGIPPTPLPETDADGFFYLPYTASPGDYYDGVSVIDILSGDIGPDYYAGKIVLIGPYAVGMQDQYITTIDRAVPMYGIEIQANLADAFRCGFYPTEAARLLSAIIVFVLAALLFFFLYERNIYPALGSWLGVSAAWVIFCILACRSGVLHKVFYVPFAAAVIFIATVAINYVRAQKEKRRVTATFGRYVDPAILKELLKDGSRAGDLGGATFTIAVLFVDIRGFTTMSESLPPQTVVEILNRYLSLTTDCIMRHHGTLDKFVGDCTMAFWNAPLPQEDPVYLACCAARDMVEGSKALGEELTARFGRTVSFGVGVHIGPAVVGNIGAPRRMDYTAIGDTVNTASRLESNAPGGKILISREVADILGDRAKVTSLGSSIKLKGKAEGFETLTLDELY